MTGAIASFLHLLGLVIGLSSLFARSYFVGGSLLGRLWRGISRFVDVAMMWPTPHGPQPALEPPLDRRQMRRVLVCDTVTLVGASLWIASGLWRFLGGLDKATAWYEDHHLFVVKLALVGLMLVVELLPMTVFLQWRYAVAAAEERERRAERGDDGPLPTGPLMRLFLSRGEEPWMRPVRAVRWAHAIEEVVVVAILFTATLMARGVGYHAFGVEASSSPACEVVALLQRQCARCHRGPAAQGGLDFGDDPRAALVGVASHQWPEVLLVQAGDPDGSLLYAKLVGPPVGQGSTMPLGSALPAADVDTVRAWIDDGASPCLTVDGGGSGTR